MEPPGRVRQARGDPEEAEEPRRKRRIRGTLIWTSWTFGGAWVIDETIAEFVGLEK